nr:phage holin family protein [Serratia rubidaea]
MLNDYLLIVNAVTCAVIAARMLLYRRNGTTHRPLRGVLCLVADSG